MEMGFVSSRLADEVLKWKVVCCWLESEGGLYTSA